MISFIIPTIYKSQRVKTLVKDLCNCELVSEILIIEDTDEYNDIDLFFPFCNDKINLIPFTEKRYCNGAWNFGVKNIKNDYYALCNDDINFNTSIIYDVINFYKQRPKSGFIGMHYSQYDVNTKPYLYGFELKDKYSPASRGWGCLIFNHKDNDVMIPSDLKHWCGDTYYLLNSKYPSYSYYGDKIYTEMSTSISSNILDIGKEDQKTLLRKYASSEYKKYLKQHHPNIKIEDHA